MSNIIETINYKGILIDTYYDEDYQTPSDWEDTDNFLVYDHRQFNVGVKGFEPRNIFEQIQETKRFFYDGYFVFPVYAYIHSGVALSLGRSVYPFNDNWDVSSTGFCLIKRQKGSYSKVEAEKIARSIVDEWNMALSGDVYGYSSEADSCCGFYGREGYKRMVEEAKSEIDYYIKQEITKHLQILKQWIKNHVPLEKRTSCNYVYSL